eukprot:3965303-Lingulodinium_polyedra.AAC.1
MPSCGAPRRPAAAPPRSVAPRWRPPAPGGYVLHPGGSGPDGALLAAVATTGSVGPAGVGVYACAA